MNVLTIVTILSFLACPVLAQENTVHLALEDIQEYGRQHAPRAKLIQNTFDREVAESKAALQWRNPELEFEAERLSNDLHDEQETTIMVGKDIAMPWVHAQHKSSQQDRISTEKAERETKLRHLIAELKSEYVELWLITDKHDRLSQLEGMIEGASTYAAEQYREGMISALQQQLIHLSLMNVRGRLMSLNQHRQQCADQFKTDLGLREDRDVRLTTSIDFVPPDRSRIETALTKLEQIPDYQAHLYLQQALKKQIALEKMNVLSEMHISGGYKEAGEHFKGYVIGLSVPLPILNRNRPKIEQSRLEYESASIEFEAYKLQLKRQLNRHQKSIDEFTTFFQTNMQTFNRIDDSIEDHIFAFREGFLNVSDFLNGILMHTEAIDNYFDHLNQYYRTVFSLEALIGESIVSL